MLELVLLLLVEKILLDTDPRGSLSGIRDENATRKHNPYEYRRQRAQRSNRFQAHRFAKYKAPSWVKMCRL